MQFGVFMTMPSPVPKPAAEIYARGIEIAQTADDLGFSHLWLAEHHFTNYAYISRPLMLLSHIAAKTKQIRLGPAIIPVPLHHPLIVAEELAMIDVLSGGRVEVGLGKGYQQYQYDRFGMVKGSDVERYNEAIEVIKLAMHQPTFEYQGDVFHIPSTRLYPQPIQPRAPFWLVVNSTVRESVEHAVTQGMNLFTGVLEPISKLTDVRKNYPDLAPQLANLRVGTQRLVYVAENEADALAAVEHARWNGRASIGLRHDFASVADGVVSATPLPNELSTDILLDDYLVIGTADQCIRQIERIRNGLGCDYFSASFWFGSMSQGKVLASMRRFAEHVMPAFATKHASHAHPVDDYASVL